MGTDSRGKRAGRTAGDESSTDIAIQVMSHYSNDYYLEDAVTFACLVNMGGMP